MTRLDPAGEPSMEEILASIRRIIAEDPPGSRPEPEAKPGRQLIAPGRAPADLVSAEGRSAPDPAASSQAAQAGLSAQSNHDAHQDKIASASYFSLRPALDTAGAGTEARPQSKLASPLTIMPPGAIAPRQAPAFDIDAQLADVLGGPAKAASPLPAVPGPSIGTSSAGVEENSKETVQAALDSLALHANADTDADALAGFTLSQEAYVPGGTEAAPPAPASLPSGSATQNSDPFEFSLGPSPFARREAPPPSAPGKDVFGAFIPSRESISPAGPDQAGTVPQASPFAVPKPVQPDFGTMSSFVAAAEAASPQAASAIAEVEAPVENRLGEALSNVIAVSASAPAPAAVPAFTSRDVEPKKPVSDELTEDDRSSSQADAFVPIDEDASGLSDIAPHPAVTTATTEVGVSAMLTQMPFETSRADAAEVELVEPEKEHVAEEKNLSNLRELETDVRMENYPASGNARLNDGRSLVPHSDSDKVSAQRTMEETVAELLRPMLKGWLAENMPKIVERALRKELAESKSFAHKPAAE